MLETTYVANSSSVNVEADTLRNIKLNQMNSNRLDANTTNTKYAILQGNLTTPTSTPDQTSNVSIGNTVIVAYKSTEYDPKKMINIDPVLGDIIIGKNDLVILRGGWKNRNGIYFNEDPKSTDGFSTINVIWKGVTYKK